MRRTSFKRPLILALFLCSLFFWPGGLTTRLRSKIFTIFAPLWSKKIQDVSQDLVLKLEAENHQLKLELMKLQQELELSRDLSLSALAVPAHIIYRDPGQWMSSCWVDVGEATNRALGRSIIEHNAPVIVGKALVGVVDKVYENQSSIRLITDPSVKPSVRAVRGYLQNVIFAEHLKVVLRRIEDQAPAGVLNYFSQLQEKLCEAPIDWLLAKGVLQGSGQIERRSRNHLLKGIGFNCDFADSQAPARELRTGKAIDSPLPALPLIQEGDLLITTGMDGVFPMGLPVAEVTAVYPLKEGAYAYDIEATPIVKNMDILQTVCIIPKSDFKKL